MRNLITGLFTVLAGTVLFYGQQALEGSKSKCKDQIKTIRDSAMQKTQHKTPEPLEMNVN